MPSVDSQIKKILVVEDNTDIRENIAELLELSGFQVIAAENGRIGIERARQFIPDLIICDIIMPEKDGYFVIEQIKNNSDLENIPFIFLTAKSEKADYQKGKLLGAVSYITKPFEIEELLDIIRLLPIAL